MGPRRLRKGERSFVRDVGIFMGGRSLATAITVLLTPVIARLYLPAHFGAAAMFFSIVVVVGPMACGGYDKAVTVARSTEDARTLFHLCVTLILATAIIAWLALAGLSFAGRIPENMQVLGPLLWLLPAGFILQGTEDVFGAWLLRFKRYKELASAEILQTGLRTTIRVLAGLGLGSTVGALLGSFLTSTGTKLLFMWTIISRTAPLRSQPSPWTDFDSLRTAARSYSDFPRFNLITGLMMQLTSQLPVFVLGATFGPEVVGFFAMADRIARTPISVASNTLRMAFLQKLSEIWNDGRPIRAQLTKVVIGMILLGAVPMFVFWTRGEELFAFVLGDRWIVAGRYIEIMVPFFAVAFLGAPFQAATAAMRRQRLWFWLELITAIARLTIIPVAALDGVTPETVLRVYVWTTSATKVMAFVVVYFQVPRTHTGLNKE